MTILEGTIDYPPSCDTDAKRAWFREAVEDIRKSAAPRPGERMPPEPQKNPPWPRLPAAHAPARNRAPAT